MTDALPKGWTWISVGDLASTPQDITDGPFGSNLKTEHYTMAGPRVIRLQNIGDGLFLNEKAHIAPGHFERLKKHEVKPGDVVVAMLGEHLPRACVVPTKLGPAIVKADCVRLRTDSSLTSPKFVSAGLNSAAVRQQGDELMHGVGRPRLGLKWFRTLRFPLAPLAEQERVVDAIDSYLSRLDEAVASLERVQAKLKAYRASVLKAAVEGRLVPTEASLARAEKRAYEPAEVLLARILKERRRRWEEAELAKLKAAGKTPKDDRWKARYQEPVAPDRSKLPELAEGWCWATVDMLGNVKGGLTKGQRRHPKQVLRDVPYLRVANVQRGYLDLSEVKTIRATPDEIIELRLEPGDVLFNEGGDRDKLGRGWIWGGEIETCIHQNHVFRVRIFTEDLQPRLLSWYGNSSGQQYFFDEGKQTTNLASVNMTKLKLLPVPIPPKREQLQIGDEVERMLSVADEVAVAVTHDIKRCARLRQAVLKWAFEGKLVDQDPTDEPADKLLARIRAERAAVSPVRKTLGGRAREAA